MTCNGRINITASDLDQETRTKMHQENKRFALFQSLLAAVDDLRERLFKDWFRIGQEALLQLPPNDWKPFIEWLQANPDILDIYVKDHMEVVKMWQATKDEHIAAKTV